MMETRSTQQFMKLMRCYLCGEPLSAEAIPATDEALTELIDIGAKHHMLPMVFDALGNSEAAISDFPHWLILRRRALVMVAEQIQKRAAFASIYIKLTEKGIRPLVVKGFIAATLYPTPHCRTSSDEDLFVPLSARDECATALVEAGMVAADDGKQVELFYHPESGLRVELHTEFFPEYMASAAKMNSWFADASVCAIEKKVGKWTFYTLCPTDHFLYLVCHAFKHFVHSGFGIRQLCDCMLFALAYIEEIDWTLVWVRLKEIHAALFLANLRAICEREFGCDFYTPIMAEFEDRLDPDDLLADLLDAGIYGDSCAERKQSSVITLQAANGEGSGGRLAALFPPRSTLKGRYRYLQKFPFLLPIAWLQRALEYLGKRSKGESAAPEAILEVGRSRTQLLTKYGVIEEEQP